MTTNIYLFLSPTPDGLNCYREVHPFGPSDTNEFHSDVRVEISPSNVDPYSKGIAVLSGNILFIPDESSGAPSSTGSILLNPDPQSFRDIVSTIGPCNLVFLYRNVDSASVRRAAFSIIESRMPFASPL